MTDHSDDLFPFEAMALGMLAGRIDFADLDFLALKAAHDGDFKELAGKLRSGAHLSSAERNFLADKLEGKIKLKRGAKRRLQYLDSLVAEAFVWLMEFDGIKKKDAAHFALAEFIGESERNVAKRVKRATDECALSVFVMRMRIAAHAEGAVGAPRPTLFDMDSGQLERARNVFLA